MDTLSNITVNFVYESTFIGEIQFLYKEETEEYKSKYYANHFIYEFFRAQEKIEILAAINK